MPRQDDETIDITPHLRQLIAWDRKGWTEDSATSLAHHIAGLAGDRVDWDWGVPENWAVVFNGRELVAMVGILWPMVIVKRGAVPLPPDLRAEVIEVDFEGRELRMDKDVAIEFFGPIFYDPDEDFDHMSVPDFYVNTVTIDWPPADQ